MCTADYTRKQSAKPTTATKQMSYGVYNVTRDRWALKETATEITSICEPTVADAERCKRQLDELKQLNPKHRNDVYEVRPRS